MSRPGEPPPVLLFASLLYAREEAFEEGSSRLERAIGPCEPPSPSMPFDCTDYYSKEMGGNLLRRFIVFKDLVGRDALPEVKHRAFEIEEEMAPGDRRRVNVDPGYIAAEHMVLATFKPYSHRLYLGEGVYADLTLIFQGNEFQPLPWSYPDYASAEIRKLFGGLRRNYLKNLKES